MRKKVISILLTLTMLSSTLVGLVPSYNVSAADKASVSDSKYINENITSVKNQNPLGLCWAFSTIAACEAELVQNNGLDKDSLDLSEFQLGYFGFNRMEDPLGNYTEAHNDWQTLSPWFAVGHNQYAAMNALAAWSAGADESTIPYNRYETEAKAYYESKTKEELSDLSYNHNNYHLENAYLIDSQDQDEVKQAILDYGGVVMSFHMEISDIGKLMYFDDKVNYAMYHHTKQEKSNHEVLIVGWDDEFDKFDELKYLPVKPGKKGAWRIKNSYGDGEADSGYFWISYEDKTIDRWMYAYDMEPATNFDNNYQYDNDISGVIQSESSSNGGVATESDIYSSTAMNKDTCKAANIFEVKANATGYETLEAVSFISYARNGNYTIKIYKDLLDDEDPESGELVDTLKGNYKLGGYHTVRTNKSIIMTEGTTFSVVVENVDSTGKQLGVSTATGDMGIDAKAKKGQSFLYRYGSWEDQMVGEGYEQPVCQIKAFTKNVAAEGATDISFNETEYYLSLSDAGTYLKATVDGSPYAPIKWSSSDETIVKVSKGGKIYPVSEGECTITASSNGHTATCKVYVCESPAKINDLRKDRYGNITWSKIIGSVGYNIYVKSTKEDGSDYKKIDATFEEDGDVMIGTPNDSNLVPGRTYYLRVCGYRLVNEHEIEGAKSDYIWYTEPIAEAENFRVVSATKDSITLAWDPVVGAESYRVAYTSDTYHQDEVTGTTHTITGLEPGNSYSITLIADSEKYGAQCSNSMITITASTLEECVLTKVEAVPATCISYGVKEYYACSCGKYYLDEDGLNEIIDLDAWKARDGRIAKKGHTWDAGIVTTPATCKEMGVKTFHCTFEGCSETKTEDIAIDSSNHINIEVIGKKDATCTEKGYTGDTYCKDCDTTIKGTDIAAKNHDFTKYVSIGNGKHKVVCINCDEPQEGHENDTCSGGTATCKAKAICSKCGEEYGELATHTGGTATCKAKAKCTVCGKEYGELAAHSYATKWSSDATNHWHACTVCGAKKDNAAHADSNKDGKCDTCSYNMHTHAGIKVAQVDATCSTYGVKAYYKCSCGKYYADSACTKEITDLAAWKNGEGRIAKKAHSLNIITTKATTSKDGKLETKCSACGKVTKTEIIYAVSNINLSKDKYAYTGKVQKPVVTVKDSKGNVIASSNYDIKYPTGMKNVGEYIITITLKGDKYTGTKNLSYVINPAKTTIKSVKPASKSLTVNWTKKDKEVTGYEIQYSTDKNFKSGNKKVTIKSAKTTNTTIKKLKAGKKYYVRIRTYKNVGSKNYYSDWSAKKVVTVKK